MSRGWCTKDDVLKDLELVSGHRPEDVGDDYFVYGEQPPPPPRPFADEVSELSLQFGGEVPQELGQGDQPEPDLVGIKNMLRMVQNYEHSSDEELSATPNKTLVITKPSKLTSDETKQKDNIMPGASNQGNMTPKKRKNKNKASNKKTNLSSPSTSIKSPDSLNKCIDATTPKASTSKSINKSPLNPNVKEFVPRNMLSMASSSNTTTEQIDKINVVEKVVNEIDAVVTDEVKTKKATHDTTTTKHVTLNVDSSKESKESKKQMAIMLKNQISSKSSTFKEKQQTNKAIVNLLKLYADPKPAKPVKLLPPEYFEKSKVGSELGDGSNNESSIQRMALLHDVEDKDVATDSRNNSSQESTSVVVGSEKSDMMSDVSILKEREMQISALHETEKDSDVDTSYHKDSEKIDLKVNDGTVCDDDTEETQLTPDMGDINLDAEPPYSENIDVDDPQIKESISKVTNWLHDKPVVTVPKPRSPMLQLGAVAYKRKETVTCKSPSETTEKKISKVSEFKPSSYAEELHKQYTDRARAAPGPVQSTWDRLAADLEKRDEQIKNRKVPEPSTSKKRHKSKDKS